MTILRFLAMVLVRYRVRPSFSSVFNLFSVPLVLAKRTGRSHNQIIFKSVLVMQGLYIEFVIAWENGNQK